MPQPGTKLAAVAAAMHAGDHAAALRIAARFPRLGTDAAAITRGWAAWSNPTFYRAIGHDPAALIQAGVDALRARYHL